MKFAAFLEAALTFSQRNYGDGIQGNNIVPYKFNGSHAMREMHRRGSVHLHDINKGENKDCSGQDGFNGDSELTERERMLFNIMNKDMASLQDQFKNGANPDTELYNGDSVAHRMAAITIKATDSAKDIDGYFDVLRQLGKSGVNFSKTNNQGMTALDITKLNGNQLGGIFLKLLEEQQMNIPCNGDEINSQLETIALQKNPSLKARGIVVRLIKVGGNINAKIADRDTTILEEAQKNWSDNSSGRLQELAYIADIKATIDSQGKVAPEKPPVNNAEKEQVNSDWIGAVRDFCKDAKRGVGR